MKQNKGIELAWLLRHDKEGFERGYIDANGWRKVSELIENHAFTEEMLDEIVDTNNKQRFEYNEDKTKIRARQGHSIKVDVGLKLVENPPKRLFHGTSEDVVEKILEDGLKPMTRQHVHLSHDRDTALKVGKRHGTPCVLVINVEDMVKDKVKFYISNNGVYLVDKVAPKYIKKLC